MGASGSKQTTSAVRKFPTRAPGSAPPRAAPSARPPRVPPPARDTTIKSKEATATQSSPANPAAADDQNNDAPLSPDFAMRLQQMGIAQPNPIFSPSSIANITPSSARNANAEVMMRPEDFAAPQFPAASNNATLGALEARRQLEQRAAQEFETMGKAGYQGREFLDISTIRNILVMRQRGNSPSEIETRLRLKPGVVARLGRPGVVEPAV